jgi:hypothetical protein
VGLTPELVAAFVLGVLWGGYGTLLLFQARLQRAIERLADLEQRIAEAERKP